MTERYGPWRCCFLTNDGYCKQGVWRAVKSRQSVPGHTPLVNIVSLRSTGRLSLIQDLANHAFSVLR